MTFNILTHIVDDDTDSIDLIVSVLEGSGITEYKIYTRPEEFLEENQEVHLCILDYRFINSGMTGLEITEELLKRNKRCRVIIVTIAPNFNDFMKVYNAGAWKYIDKSDKNFNPDLIRYVKMGIALVNEEVELLHHIKKRFNRD